MAARGFPHRKLLDMNTTEKIIIVLSAAALIISGFLYIMAVRLDAKQQNHVGRKK